MPAGIQNTIAPDPLTAMSRRLADLERKFREQAAAIQSGAAVSASTSTLTNVASSVTSVTLLAANPNRLGAVLFNDSTSVLFLSYGTPASSTSYTVKLAAGGSWTIDVPIFTGAITGIWTTANGACRITDLTA